MNTSKVQRICFKQISDPRGNITPIEFPSDLPFPIARVYYLYGVPNGGERGGHAHKNLIQVLIAASGEFDVVLHDGKTEVTERLNRPNEGLLVPRLIWRELKNFSLNAVCLVLASEVYLEDDYIRDFTDFLQVTNDQSSIS